MLLLCDFQSKQIVFHCLLCRSPSSYSLRFSIARIKCHTLYEVNIFRSISNVSSKISRNSSQFRKKYGCCRWATKHFYFFSTSTVMHRNWCVENMCGTDTDGMKDQRRKRSPVSNNINVIWTSTNALNSISYAKLPIESMEKYSNRCKLILGHRNISCNKPIVWIEKMRRK